MHEDLGTYSRTNPWANQTVVTVGVANILESRISERCTGANLCIEIVSSFRRRLQDGSSATIRLSNLGAMIMRGLPQKVMQHAEACPEATPLCSAALLHLGDRAAVNKALSRLARSGALMRVVQGVYMRPVQTPFGRCSPSTHKAIEALSALWGQTIVPCGGSAANRLRLTTQNPVREVYLTSGPGRRLKFGPHVIELRHAPRWQLAAPHRRAGDVIRALSWLGREEVDDALEAVIPMLSVVDLEELADIHDIMPKWMAGPIRARLSHRFMFSSRDVDAPHGSRSMESSMKDQLGCVAIAR